MACGILLLGLNGCGKTTVGHKVAARLGFLRMDAEDYYFPTPGDYATSRTQDDVHRLMEKDIACCSGFVLSCVRCNVTEEILRQIHLAVVLRTSPELRAQRIVQRELDRFGSRVLPGGDMYEAQQTFHAFAAARTEETVNSTLNRLNCPVMALDAALPVNMIAEQICAAWQQTKRTERV